MSSAAPGTTLGVSRSSIRTSHEPRAARARRKLPAAANSDPRCNFPVGEGAKRPRYVWVATGRGLPVGPPPGAARWSPAPAGVTAGLASAVAIVPVAVLLLAPLAALLRFHAQGCDRPRFQALDA